MPEIRIAKTPEIQERLRGFLGRKARKRFSATAFSTYLDCRLRFYFKYVAELKEPRRCRRR
ncbi:hypothetical protein A3SI_10029 [Nitritalea halalkaliphila LW7]|uniref:Uncharacterized protein n=1 Tax=Nitritalea halalkaliphila LW7 TaxID=1189621 RepID=I5C3H0_9BACT|nr:PD-(D/E)XK nuclease family protein [Nitritalea halalkaliphila]EIM76372.1 hypothetical protein A3SI_10029 [Nitritalea halalkaliphila LW7]